VTITLMIATVRIEPGWAVGNVTVPDPAIDRDVLLDAAGRPWVPGSALAGSLRAHLAAADPPADSRLMGRRPAGDPDAAGNTDEANGDRPEASPLWVVGCTFSPDGDEAGDGAAALEITGQTAIDRARGAAAVRSLRFSRLAASGGTLTVYLRHDPPDGQPLGGDDLALISRWQPAIGRDRTKGSGRAALTELRHGTVDPATQAGARVWLSHSGPGLFDAVATQVIACHTDHQPWLEARFSIEDGLLTWDGVPGPAARPRQRLGRPLIPGSAWKGIIRSRAEFIIRSRYGEAAACPEQAGCGRCPVCAVFGHQARRGLLAFRDSYIEQPSLEQERTQVGIDRVTGGSRDALLFQTQRVAEGNLRLRIDTLGEIPPWVRNLIQHVLRDIDDALIGVGSRTTRGLGTLRLTDPLGDLEPVIIPELETATATGLLS
jgi:CRISPR/Cas system CSM-associated protein Csm3 (group 7 of RAMP superfamily)